MDHNGKTPIACSSCAKAKAKCDKKIPCTRCANKRINCQPRTARRSCDTTTSSKNNRQPDSSASSSSPQPRSNTENLFQWATGPLTPSSMSFATLPHLSSIPPALATDVPPVLDNTMTSSDLPFDFSTSQGLLRTGLTRSPPNNANSMTPAMQPFAGMGGSLEDYNTSGGNQPSETEGIGNSMDLSIPLMPDFSLPMDGLQNMDYFDPYPVPAKGASDPSRFSGPSSSAHHSEVGSPLRAPSLSSRPPSRKAFSDISQTYLDAVQEHKAVTAAQEGWSCFRCNPPTDPSACPKTARIHLEGLEQALKSQDAWQQRDLQPDMVKPASNKRSISIEPFSSFTRDKLLAITQTFLHKALEIHYANFTNRQSASYMAGTGFIILPPPIVLEHFLDAYVCRFEPYYTFIPARALKPNDLMQGENARASSILLLFMVAHGAAATPTTEARYLTSGLTEACRISLFDMIDKDIELVQNLIVLRCGLLFTTVAVWSGDKWHMDIAMGQRGMYISMLGHAGLLDFRDTRLSTQECLANPEMAWERWKEHEGRSRLVASWVLVDQELSLFMDIAPMLSFTNLNTTMPDADELWQAESSSEWLKAYEYATGASNKPRMSLCDLFRFFMDGELSNPNVHLTPIQLRLLLHPFQSLAIHLRQFLSCFPEGGSSSRKASRAMTKSATRARLEEVQSLLRQWYALAGRCSADWTDGSAPTSVNLIMYHLISLNTIVCLPEVERVARNNTSGDLFRPSSLLQASCTEDGGEIFFHCGQILRLLRAMPESVRPPWWPAAIYRAALISWLTSMANAKARSLLSSLGREANQPFAIDTLTPEHPSLVRYLNTGEGQPMFSRRDGTMMSLEVPQNILTYCVEMLREERTTRFKDGIQSKLARLADRWKTWKVQ